MLYNMPVRKADNGNTQTHTFNGPVFYWTKRDSEWQPVCSWAMCKSASCSRQITTPAPTTLRHSIEGTKTRHRQNSKNMYIYTTFYGGPMINIFKMFTIGPRYSFGCPAVYTLASCGVLWCPAVFCGFQAYRRGTVIGLWAQYQYCLIISCIAVCQEASEYWLLCMCILMYVS